MSLHSFVSELEGYTTIPLEKQILFEKRRVILEESNIKKYNNAKIIEIENGMSCEEIEWLNDTEMDNAIILAHLDKENDYELTNLCFRKSKEKRLFLLRAIKIANDSVIDWFCLAIHSIESDAHLDVLKTIVKKHREHLYTNCLFLNLLTYFVFSKEHLLFLINDLKIFMFENRLFSNTDKLMWMMSKPRIHDWIAQLYRKLFLLYNDDTLISHLEIVNPVFITYISKHFPVEELIRRNRVEVIRKIIDDFIQENISFQKKFEKFIFFFKSKGLFEQEDALRKMFSLKRVCKEQCYRPKE